MSTATWIGGPQDGATVVVPEGVTWVTVLEDNRQPVSPAEAKTRSLIRYSVPVIDGKIVWAQRKVSDA